MARGPHEYDPGCPCYRCKGIRNAPINHNRLVPRMRRQPRERIASREEQHARYLDCGSQAWDDRGDR